MNAVRRVLINKMEDEYNAYINRIKLLPADIIIGQSYETVFKKDILLCFENENFLNEATIIHLLQTERPLEELYQIWLCVDITYMDRLQETIEEFL